MTSIEITYCVPCGFRDRALDIAETVLEDCEGDLDELQLTMASHEFWVAVDGATVWTNSDSPFDQEEILTAVKAKT